MDDSFRMEMSSPGSDPTLPSKRARGKLQQDTTMALEDGIPSMSSEVETPCDDTPRRQRSARRLAASADKENALPEGQLYLRQCSDFSDDEAEARLPRTRAERGLVTLVDGGVGVASQLLANEERNPLDDIQLQSPRARGSILKSPKSPDSAPHKHHSGLPLSPKVRVKLIRTDSVASSKGLVLRDPSSVGPASPGINAAFRSAAFYPSGKSPEGDPSPSSPIPRTITWASDVADLTSPARHLEFDAPEFSSEGEGDSDEEKDASVRARFNWRNVKAKVVAGHFSKDSPLKRNGSSRVLISEKQNWQAKAKPRVDTRNTGHKPGGGQVKIINEKVDFTHVKPKVDTGIHHNTSMADLQDGALRSPSYFLRSPSCCFRSPTREGGTPKVGGFNFEKVDYTHVQPKVDTGRDHNSSMSNLQDGALRSPSYSLRSPSVCNIRSPNREERTPKLGATPNRHRTPSTPNHNLWLARQLSSPRGFPSPTRSEASASGIGFSQFMELADKHNVSNAEEMFREMEKLMAACASCPCTPALASEG